MKALRQDVAFLAFRPTLPAGSFDAQKVLGGARNHSPSLWSFSAIPAGVSVYFLHFYNQYSSFVSLFLLCPSLFTVMVLLTC